MSVAAVDLNPRGRRTVADRYARLLNEVGFQIHCAGIDPLRKNRIPWMNSSQKGHHSGRFSGRLRTGKGYA